MERNELGSLVGAEGIQGRLGALVAWEVVGDGSVETIRHGLGRVPRGMVVVNQEGVSGVGAPAAWWREAGDGDWSLVEVRARWTEAGSVVVWVF